MNMLARIFFTNILTLQGYLSLSQMKEENILDTLGLANQYGFSELELAISEYLRQILSVENVCAILDAAR